MGNVSIRGGLHNQLWATLLNGEQESSVIDLGDAAGIEGLMVYTTMTYGSLTFKVSPTANGPFVTVKDDTGADWDPGPFSGVFAMRTNDLACLMPYRYIRVRTSVAQASGLLLCVSTRS